MAIERKLSSNCCSRLSLQLFIAGSVSNALQSEAVADGRHFLNSTRCRVGVGPCIFCI